MLAQLCERIPNPPALSLPDFRFLALANTVSGFGLMGERVVISWLALELTDSPFAVGLNSAMGMIPSLLFGLPFGAIVDSLDRRKLMRLLTLGSVAPALIAAALAAAGRLEFWHLMVLTFASGSMQTFRGITNQSLAYDIVGPAHATNGLAITSLSTRLGGIVGAIATGSLIQRAGVQYAFLGLAASYTIAFVSLIGIRSRGQAAPEPRGKPLEGLVEFFRELRHNRTLLALVATTSAVEMLGFSHQVLLPSIARDALQVGAEGLGIMNGVRSVGGIVAMSVLAARRDFQRRGVLYLSIIHAFGILLIMLGRAEGFYTVLVILTGMNVAMTLADVLSQTMIQLSVPNELRGRAVGSWNLAIGTGPLGGAQIGAVAAALGVAAALSINGGALLALAIGTTLLVPNLRRL